MFTPSIVPVETFRTQKMGRRRYRRNYNSVRNVASYVGQVVVRIQTRANANHIQAELLWVGEDAVVGKNSNWIKDLRIEIFRKMYDKPTYPKKLWMKKDPEQLLSREHSPPGRTWDVQQLPRTIFLVVSTSPLHRS